jgi:hypothetical protein
MIKSKQREDDQEWASKKWIGDRGSKDEIISSGR